MTVGIRAPGDKCFPERKHKRGVGRAQTLRRGYTLEARLAHKYTRAQIHLALQEGANAYRNLQREALKAIRHRIDEADQEWLHTTEAERWRRAQAFDFPHMPEAYAIGWTFE